MTRGARLFLILGIGLLILDGAVFALMKYRGQDAPAAAPLVVSSGTAAIGGPFILKTTAGQTVTEATYHGKWMLIYFGYTFCPDACPTALTNISIAIQRLGEKDANVIQPLFITIDPARDTATVLGDFLKSFDPRIVGLTGSEEQTQAVVKVYRVDVESHKSEAADYLVDHSSYVYLMDPAGKFYGVVEGATPPDQMADWLRKVMGQHST